MIMEIIGASIWSFHLFMAEVVLGSTSSGKIRWSFCSKDNSTSNKKRSNLSSLPLLKMLLRGGKNWRYVGEFTVRGLSKNGRKWRLWWENDTLFLTVFETWIKGFNSKTTNVSMVITKRRNRLMFKKERLIENLERSCYMRSLKNAWKFSFLLRKTKSYLNRPKKLAIWTMWTKKRQ